MYGSTCVFDTSPELLMVSYEQKIQGAFTAKAFERWTLIESEPSEILSIEFAQIF